MFSCLSSANMELINRSKIFNCYAINSFAKLSKSSVNRV